MPSVSRKALGVASLFEQIARGVYEDRGPTDVKPTQWSALRYFDRAGSEARTVTGLARYQGVTKGAASRAVSALVRRGYIEGVTHETDKRISVFSLTEEGRELVDHDPLKKLALCIQALPAEESKSFSNVLELLSNDFGPSSGK